MSAGWWVAVALAVLWVLTAGRLHRLRSRVRGFAERIRSGDLETPVDGAGASGPESLLWARIVESLRERDRIADESKSRERLFAMIANGLRDGILVIDEDLKVTHFNSWVHRLFPTGKFREGAPLIAGVRDHRVVELARKVCDGAGSATAEIALEGNTRADGSHESVYAIEATPIVQSGRHATLMVVRDVTDRVVTEQIRRDFVANASHELRTPLTLINGYIENLLDGMLDDREMAEKSLRVMDKHGKRIVRIVEDMLTISKLESSPGALNLEPFDIVECVTDVIDNLAAPIEEKRASVEFVSDEENREMVGDRFYWDQIFINLIENALKENMAPGLQIEVGFRIEGDCLVIWVADDGVGISAEQVPFVFKRFYRGAKHHSTKVQGTGLGLSIVKRAVEAHGGTIELKSTPGVQTVFTMRVPRGDAGHPAGSQRAAASVPGDDGTDGVGDGERDLRA